MTDTALLERWLADHPSTDEVVAEWRAPTGGMSFPAYSATIDDFWEAVEALGWPVETRDYHAVLAAWRAEHAEVADVEQIAAMDRHTLFNRLRSVQRSERFGDGNWEAAFRGGVMHALARALVAMEGRC